jgi:hypothetical protein
MCKLSKTPRSCQDLCCVFAARPPRWHCEMTNRREQVASSSSPAPTAVPAKYRLWGLLPGAISARAGRDGEQRTAKARNVGGRTEPIGNELLDRSRRGWRRRRRFVWLGGSRVDGPETVEKIPTDDDDDDDDDERRFAAWLCCWVCRHPPPSIAGPVLAAVVSFVAVFPPAEPIPTISAKAPFAAGPPCLPRFEPP